MIDFFFKINIKKGVNWYTLCEKDIKIVDFYNVSITYSCFKFRQYVNDDDFFFFPSHSMYFVCIKKEIGNEKFNEKLKEKREKQETN